MIMNAAFWSHMAFLWRKNGSADFLFGAAVIAQKIGSLLVHSRSHVKFSGVAGFCGFVVLLEC